jgi:hypothetical protein
VADSGNNYYEALPMRIILTKHGHVISKGFLKEF